MRKVYDILILGIVFVSSLGNVSAFSSVYWKPEHPLVIEIAKDLKGSTDLETAENIWNWMNENVSYEAHTDNTPEEVILTGEGNCTDQAYLAASLLLAVDFGKERVRIAEGGKGPESHTWVEIYTDKWHRYDTTHYHSFAVEFSKELYQEGVDYVRIDYYYYEPPKQPSRIILLDKSVNLLNQIHEITVTIKNEGESQGYFKMEAFNVSGNTQVIGFSHEEGFYISPQQTITTKVFIRGEGEMRIEIDEISFEVTLSYSSPSEEQMLIEETPQVENTLQESKEPSSDLGKKIIQTSQTKRICAKKGEPQDSPQREDPTPETSSFLRILFLFMLPILVIPVFLFLRRKRN